MKYKRITAFLLCCVMLAFPLSGCSGRTSTAGKMHYDLAQEPINLDPQTASDAASMTVINQIFEGLFTLDQEGSPVPAAAESYVVSEDELVYTIQVRNNLRWEDGKELTAEDYAFGLQRILLPETQSPHASQFFGIRGAEAYHEGRTGFESVGIRAEGNTLTLTLNEPDEHFLHLLTLTAAMPCDEEFFNETRGKYGLEADVTPSNGPFYLNVWSHEEYLKLTKSENFRDRENVKISGVTMWTNNAENREETFWNGKTQACYVSGESYDKNGSEDYPAEAISNTVYGIVFNQGKEPLRNRYIRKAMAALTDRSIYEKELPGYLQVTDRAFASDCALNSRPCLNMVPDGKTAEFSPEKAQLYYQKGLEQLGVNALTGLKILVPEMKEVPNGDYFLKLSQNYQKYLDLYIGIDRKAPEEYEQALEAEEYDLALVPVVSEDLSPFTMMEDFLSGPYACTDPQFSELYGRLQGETLVRSAEILREAEGLLLQEAWLIPMYETGKYFVSGKNVAGVEYNPYSGLVSFRHAEYLND